MQPKQAGFIQRFFAISLSLLASLLLLRLFEYFSAASKSFVSRAYLYELLGFLFDMLTWLIWCGVLVIPLWLLSKISIKFAIVVLHILNLACILCLLGLLITFSERNTPFDHELFTRNSQDTIDTIKQMMGGGIKPYLPFLFFIPVYFIFSRVSLKKIQPAQKTVSVFVAGILLSILFIGYANPDPDHFSQRNTYYLTVNKLAFWTEDSYRFLFDKKSGDSLQNIPEEIRFYQQNQPFQFTDNAYPLLHRNNEQDVLGSFFNLRPQPPNIVILVVEGLSSDFSGDHASAGSFTPFLDSLSGKSLVWDNFLSTAPGTFAAHPAISGSLPYGKRGFSVMNIMPDHLSLIRILRANGYYTRFMVGFNPDFDNMGGYIRFQGTDFILSKFPSKYREMGVGKEGWSMGYPDDALYSRSFEVMDSVKKYPYLDIYHTGTTHMPYLFEQKKAYEKKFDQKIGQMKLSPELRQTLQGTKEVLVTFMFSDDCIRKFFADYSKRPEYSNTIFLITGDHHIGSFPSIGEIDDYHVPLIIYSPMLKKAEKFLSVNSHNNIAPTLVSFLSQQYHFTKNPEQVHWLGSVMDTARKFRNIHSMPFMSWSREITDYLYRDYFISGDQLYRLNPDLTQEKIVNDSLLKKIVRLRENFQVINNYVCGNNRIYPKDKALGNEEKELLYSYGDNTERTIYTRQPDTAISPLFRIPHRFRYLEVDFSAKVQIPDKDEDNYPTVRFALIDTTGRKKNFLYWSKRDIATLAATNFTPKSWNSISATDRFTLSDYQQTRNLDFELALFGSPAVINLRMSDKKLRIYGVR
jgi:uncharacterized sulfatase